MDSARDVNTQEIVEAEGLWLLDVVDQDGYLCTGCDAQVFPKSFRPTNKLRAHFSLGQGKTHVNGCDVAGHDAIVAKGKKQTVREELEASPGLSPAALKLVEKRPMIDPSLPVDEGRNKTVARPNSAGGLVTSQSRREANTIRPICRAFLRFPHDRGLSLNLPGVRMTTYQTAFKVLKSQGIEAYVEKRIFFAQPSWSAVVESEECFIITLLAGEKKPDFKTDGSADQIEAQKPVRRYRIRVDWKDWSQAKRTMLKNEILLAREESKKPATSDGAERAYIFFLGAQDAEDLSIFHVQDQRLICALTGQLEFPSR